MLVEVGVFIDVNWFSGVIISGVEVSGVCGSYQWWWLLCRVNISGVEVSGVCGLSGVWMLVWWSEDVIDVQQGTGGVGCEQSRLRQSVAFPTVGCCLQHLRSSGGCRERWSVAVTFWPTWIRPCSSVRTTTSWRRCRRNWTSVTWTQRPATAAWATCGYVQTAFVGGRLWCVPSPRFVGVVQWERGSVSDSLASVRHGAMTVFHEAGVLFHCIIDGQCCWWAYRWPTDVCCVEFLAAHIMAWMVRLSCSLVSVCAGCMAKWPTFTRSCHFLCKRSCFPLSLAVCFVLTRLSPFVP